MHCYRSSTSRTSYRCKLVKSCTGYLSTDTSQYICLYSPCLYIVCLELLHEFTHGSRNNLYNILMFVSQANMSLVTQSNNSPGCAPVRVMVGSCCPKPAFWSRHRRQDLLSWVTIAVTVMYPAPLYFCNTNLFS